MRKIDPKSLASNIDIFNETHFYGRSIGKIQKERLANWIARRQGLPGSYAKMFAPTEYDLSKGIRLFTGERIDRGAAVAHILGEEACRALLLLDVPGESVKNALKKATQGMLSKLDYEHRRHIGWYCCGTCSSSFWRHLAAGGLNKNRMRLSAGLALLKNLRDHKGSWHRMPFFYTLLALSEINLPQARQELRYAAPRCKRYLKYARRNDKYARRRRHLVQKALETR